LGRQAEAVYGFGPGFLALTIFTLIAAACALRSLARFGR
jgi:hypothetical protein